MAGKKDYDSRVASPVPDAPGNVDPRPLRVAPDGRLLIPAAMRQALQLGEGGHVVAHVEAGELRVMAQSVSIEQVQARMRKYRRPGVSEVDEFLAQRRAMWGEE